MSKKKFDDFKKKKDNLLFIGNGMGKSTGEINSNTFGNMTHPSITDVYLIFFSELMEQRGQFPRVCVENFNENL